VNWVLASHRLVLLQVHKARNNIPLPCNIWRDKNLARFYLSCISSKLIKILPTPWSLALKKCKLGWAWRGGGGAHTYPSSSWAFNDARKPTIICWSISLTTSNMRLNIIPHLARYESFSRIYFVHGRESHKFHDITSIYNHRHSSTWADGGLFSSLVCFVLRFLQLSFDVVATSLR
jgi:hypothetical protein